MSNKYEDEVYNFFTQIQNFETMLKVLEHSDGVIKRIVKDFWDDLKLELEKRNTNTNWQVDFSDNFDNRWNKLMLYKQEWRNDKELPKVALAFENIHLGENLISGVFVNIRNNHLDANGLRDAIRDLSNLKQFNQNPWWSVWMHSKIELNKTERLVELIGENKKRSIEYAVEELLEWQKLIENDIDDLINKFKR